MKKRLFISIIFLNFIAGAQPGKEASHWYFGNRCSLDFSTGSPVPGVASTTMYVAEGCSSVSDPLTGQYLFSVMGNLAINKNGLPMANGYGLYSAINATQSSLILQDPGNANLYYIISADVGYVNNHGVHYSVVDMTQQGGLGKVVIKNKVLTPPSTTERLAGTRHCNGKDYWIITQMQNSNTFNAYEVTSSGINLTPVVSNVGVVWPHYTSTDWPDCGYLKFTPNSKKLGMAMDSDSLPYVELLDFDNSTGKFSNPMVISYPGILGPYGISFSPDNSKLYSLPKDRDSTTWLYQYDISSNIPATIIASEVLIATIHKPVNYHGYTGSLAAMQLGPDGKIYIANNGSDTLCVINAPNNPGTSCNFQYNGVVFPSPAFCDAGLPNFIDGNYAGIQVNIPDLKLCNAVIQDTLDAGAGYLSYYWNTGAYTQSIVINDTGKYWVTVTNKQGCTRTDTVHAYTIKTQKKNVTACVSYNTNVTQASVLTYNWSNGSNSPQNIFNTSGTYWVDIAYIGGCAVRDSFVVTINPNPIVDLGPDSIFCNGNLPLNAFNPNATYQWSTGETTSSIIAKEAGTYWVKVNMNNCFAYDTVEVKPDPHILNFAMPNIVTPNDDQINDVIDFGKYQFSSLQLNIYNRWGQKVFESSDAKAIWKPTGDEGTYFYSGQYKIDCGIDSQAKEIKGFVTLVR